MPEGKPTAVIQARMVITGTPKISFGREAWDEFDTALDTKT
jgi:hypothetical protein